MTFEPMNAREGERRLSPAALESLEELTAAYRARLIEQATIDNSKGEISALDFMRSVYANPETDRSTHERVRTELELSLSRRRQNRAGVIAIWTTGLGILLGALFVALGMWLLHLSLTDVAPIVLTPIVTLIALTTGRYLALSEEHQGAIMRIVELDMPTRLSAFDSDRIHDDAQIEPGLEDINLAFMRLWSLLEQKLEELAERVLPDTGRRSIGTIIKQLTYDGTLTEYESNQIKRMLTIRNDLVHGELPKNYVLRDELNEIMAVNDMLARRLDGAKPLSQHEKSQLTFKRIVAKWNDDRPGAKGRR